MVPLRYYSRLASFEHGGACGRQVRSLEFESGELE